MNNTFTKSTGFIYLLLHSLVVSTAPIATKVGLGQDASPLELLVGRFVVAVALLWAYFLCFRRDASSRSSVRPQIDRAGLIGCILAASVNCVSLYTYFLALSYLDASLMLVVYTTSVIPAVMFLLMMRGQYPSRLDFFRFLIALGGIYLFVGLAGELNGVGLLITILSAFLFATFMTIIQLRLSQYDPLTITFYVITFMTILFTIAYLANGIRFPQFNAVTWGAVLWLAIAATVVARFLFFAGIQIAGSRQAALLSPLDILLTVFWAVLLLGESVTLQQWVGTFFVIASVALGAKAKSDHVRPNSEVTSHKSEVRRLKKVRSNE